MASAPSVTNTQRHPIRVRSVSIIFMEMGLSSANKQVTARSPESDLREVTDDGGVLSSTTGDEPTCVHKSDVVPGSELETDAVRKRLGMELRRSTSIWLSLKRSTAPYSDGRLE